MVMQYDEISKKLKNLLKKSRYEHVLRVVDKAVEINKKYKFNLDEQKVRYAALLHDCAKNLEEKYFEEFKDKYNLDYDEVFEFKVLAHAILGVYVARDIYGIEDEEILGAIRWHTTGKEDMTDLEKIIYLADYIEPGRDFKDTIKKIEKALDKDFDFGLLMAMDLNIKYLIDKNAIINIESIKARNYLQRRFNG